MSFARDDSDLLTAEEFESLPDDGRMLELVRGRIVELGPPASRHGLIVARVTARVATFVEARGLGVVTAGDAGHTIARDPDTVCGPDVAFITRERMPESGPPEGYFEGPPDLAVEVISPSDSYTRVDEKTRDWIRSGCREVWLVDPRRECIEVVHDNGRRFHVRVGDELKSRVLDGLVLPVAEVFAF